MRKLSKIITERPNNQDLNLDEVLWRLERLERKFKKLNKHSGRKLKTQPYIVSASA